MLIRLAMALGVLTAAMLPLEASAERRVALVIGNATYAHAATLRNPGNDAEDVGETLKKLGFDVLIGRDLDQQGFAKTIEQFARSLDDADIALFFYAGHGLQMNDKNYLVSTNARLENEFLLSSETIELDAIVRLMESKAATNLVFLDACRNNPLTENLRRSLTALKRSTQLGRGLARMEPTGRDTLVAFAAAPGQEANDGGAERNSPFTAALLKHLPRPGLEVSVMLKEVAADVRRDTRNNQKPQQLSDMTKAFYFAKADQIPVATIVDAPRRPSASSEDNTPLDMAFWSAAQSSNDCEAVRAYLQRFPRGLFVELAKLSERRLCEAGRKITIVEPAAADAAASNVAAATLTPAIPPAPSAVARPPIAVAAVPAATSVAPSATPVTGALSTDLTRVIQLELYRLGCGTSEADGKWTVVTREGLRKFNLRTKSKLDTNEPSATIVAALQKQNGRVCPVECGRGMVARGETCVAVKPEPKKQARRADRSSRSASTRRAPAQEAAPATQAAAPQQAPMMGPPMGGMMFGIGFGRRRF